ncbi:MAG TPA: hypothetical protein ENH01_04130 [Nitrospirae bacterium]|nr:hypothetical protein [Nitrospirota bacterium]
MKNFFTTNVWLKLASLFLATGLWFLVMLSGRSEVTMDIPITFINIPPKLEVVDYPEKIKVCIEGQERLLKYLKPDEIRAVLDISEAGAGRSFYTLSRDNIKLPKSFLITSINPETISLKIEPQLKKAISVRPHVVGSPEKGFVIVEIKVDPESVILEGPESTIAKIKTIKTEPLDINGINRSLIYKANLNLSDSHIKKNIDKVEVNISVEKINKETQ